MSLNLPIFLKKLHKSLVWAFYGIPEKNMQLLSLSGLGGGVVAGEIVY